jgi:hypothetical protein
MEETRSQQRRLRAFEFKEMASNDRLGIWLKVMIWRRGMME